MINERDDDADELKHLEQTIARLIDMKYGRDENKARPALDALKKLWVSDENASGIIESLDPFGWHEACPVAHSSSE